MIGTPQRRKFSNLIVDRGALLRLSAPFFVMAAVSVGLVYVVGMKVMHALERTELRGIENLEAINALHRLQATVTTWSLWGALVLVVACLVLWLLASHRIFGPMVPIRRHVGHLLEGDYDSRIELRTGDEFRALAEDLNQLAANLKSGRAPASAKL